MSTPKKEVFGSPLKKVVSEQKSSDPSLRIPKVVHKAMLYIQKHGAEVEGLFRVPGSKDRIQALKQRIDQGEDIDFEAMQAPINDVCSLLKQYLTELPTPLMSFKFYEEFLAVVDIEDANTRLAKIQSMINSLGPENRHLLKELIRFLHQLVPESTKTKMNSDNLGTVMGPTLMWRRDSRGSLPNPSELQKLLTETKKISKLVKCLIDGYKDIFEGASTLDDEHAGIEEAESDHSAATTPVASPAAKPAANEAAHEDDDEGEYDDEDGDDEATDDEDEGALVHGGYAGVGTLNEGDDERVIRVGNKVLWAYIKRAEGLLCKYDYIILDAIAGAISKATTCAAYLSAGAHTISKIETSLVAVQSHQLPRLRVTVKNT